MAVQYKEYAEKMYADDFYRDFCREYYLTCLAERYFTKLYLVHLNEQQLMSCEEQYSIPPDELSGSEYEDEKERVKERVKERAHNAAMEEAREKAIEFYYIKCGIEMELMRCLEVGEHDMLRVLHENGETDLIDAWVKKAMDAEYSPYHVKRDEYLLLYVQDNSCVTLCKHANHEKEMEFYSLVHRIELELFRCLNGAEYDVIGALFDNAEYGLIEMWLNREKAVMSPEEAQMAEELMWAEEAARARGEMLAEKYGLQEQEEMQY